VHKLSAAGKAARFRGAATIISTLIATGLLASAGGIAAASPQPTLDQVKQQVAKLSTESDKLGQQFDQAKQDLAAANQRLALVNREAAQYRARFLAMRAEIARIAATAYENGSISSSAVLLTSGKPQQILDQSSILAELSSSNSAKMKQFLSAARQLAGAQQTARRASQAIAQLKSSLSKRKQALGKLIAREQALLIKLTPAQRAVTVPGPGGSIKKIAYTGPTSTQAQRAVQFAYAQLGKPYVWGASGPNAYDCSGLTSAAWAAAGVSIPRTSYEQWAGLTHVSTSALQPGDILVFSGASHVGLYVGHGYLIDAPHSGASVERVALGGWYQSSLDGAVRP
jgi:peptidoglycan DL-endopeptidase CwlO